MISCSETQKQEINTLAKAYMEGGDKVALAAYRDALMDAGFSPCLAEMLKKSASKYRQKRIKRAAGK